MRKFCTAESGTFQNKALYFWMNTRGVIAIMIEITGVLSGILADIYSLTNFTKLDYLVIIALVIMVFMCIKNNNKQKKLETLSRSGNICGQ